MTRHQTQGEKSFLVLQFFVYDHTVVLVGFTLFLDEIYKFSYCHWGLLH